VLTHAIVTFDTSDTGYLKFKFLDNGIAGFSKVV